MRFLFTFLMVFLISGAFYAQENIAINDLLNEAKAKLFNQPQQANKIATYIVSQNESNTIQTQAKLILAKSYYVQGNYNNAVKYAMQAKILAQTTDSAFLKFETKVFALKLLRNLDLETVATKYINELKLLKTEVHENNLTIEIEAKLKQDSAVVLFEKGELLKAARNLKNAETLFLNVNDNVSKKEIKLARAEIMLQNGELDSLKNYLEKIQKETHTDFEKLQVLNITGRLQFNNKDYNNAITTFKKALNLSLNLPNKIYEGSSLDGLTLSYLALEDTENFFAYKKQSNLVSSQIETDKGLATNTVFNFINTYLKEVSDSRIEQSYTYLYIIGGILLIIILVGFIMIYIYTSKTKEYSAIYKYIAPKKAVQINQPKPVVLEKSSIIPEETEQMLLQKLAKFETGKKYTNQDMSIALLASQFDTNTKYLSEVINRHKGKNFNGYINELRINYIIEKLKTDPVYFNYKISYLAEESGFSSHSSFATIFKSVTSISPTKFMHYLQQQKESA